MNRRILYFIIVCLAIGCGSEPPDAPQLPDPVVWTGAIRVDADALVDGQLVNLDSIIVILDQVEIGYFASPCTLLNIPEGNHRLASSQIIEDVTYTSQERLVPVSYNLITPAALTLTSANLRGVLYVEAVIDGVQTDSMLIKIDGVEVGWGENPRYLTDIAEGAHKVSIATRSDTSDYETAIRDVVVRSNDTTDISTELTKVGAYVGVHAPDLECIDLEGNNHTLSDSWGKVIYLYFFEHT